MSDQLGALGRGLLDTALGASAQEVRRWHAEALALFSDKLPSRIQNNLACVAAGLRLIEKLCACLALEWDEVFPLDMKVCCTYLQQGVREFLLEGGETNKSIVEQTLEVMDRMGLDEEQCRVMNDGKDIAIHFKGAYDRYTKYRRDHAILGECLTYSQFMRQLWKSDLYIETKVVRFGNETKKAAILDYAMLAQRCDVSGVSGYAALPLGDAQRAE